MIAPWSSSILAPLQLRTPDPNGNWINELEDYKALVSDLTVSDQGYQSDAG